MFDPFSQMSAHARQVAFLHPRRLTTWQDALRTNADRDLAAPPRSFSFEQGLASLAEGLASRLQGWRRNGSIRMTQGLAGRKTSVTIRQHFQARR